MHGFLPTRGSVMLDAVAVAMMAITVGLGISVWLVKSKRFTWHKRFQVVMTSLLLLVIVAFEIDMQVFTNWRELAEPSRFYESGAVHASLTTHLLFAIPTPFVWTFVLVQALRRFPQPPHPSEYSNSHKLWAWIAVGMMLMTSITGWIFYVLAFVC